MAIAEPFAASTDAAIAVNGGATTISQWFAAATRGLNAAKNRAPPAASYTSSSFRR